MKWTPWKFDPGTAPNASQEVLRLKSFDHFVTPPKKVFNHRGFFICFTSHWMNHLSAYGYSHTHIWNWIKHINLSFLNILIIVGFLFSHPKTLRLIPMLKFSLKSTFIFYKRSGTSFRPASPVSNCNMHHYRCGRFIRSTSYAWFWMREYNKINFIYMILDAGV